MQMRVRSFAFLTFALAGCSAAKNNTNDNLPITGGGFGGFAFPGGGGTFTQGAGGFAPTAGFGPGAAPPVGGASGFPQGGVSGIPIMSGGSPSTGGAPPVNICGKIFKDCNGNAADGCETNADSDPMNCGACGVVCPPGANAAGTCFVGKCSFACAPGWGDCDGVADNGCEDNLLTDQKNCGSCGLDCKDSACQNGGCQCASESTHAEKIPLDIYVLFDQSLSMNDNPGGGVKWNVIKGALQTFVQNPGSAGISIGIGYFPLVIASPPPVCMADADCGNYAPCTGIIPFLGGVCQKADACYAPNYVPDVPIAVLPGVSTAIVSSLNAHAPGGFTPTYPGLAGSYPYVTGWAQAHPKDKTILVLATDGDPTTCDPNTNNVNTIANNLVAPARAGNPSVLTFVIGVGSSLTSLNQIAQAGGTQQALIVDAAGADPGGQFLAAMKAIEGSVLLGCQYKTPIPQGGAAFDPTKVNVQFTPLGSTPTTIRHVHDASQCNPTDGGWYYDNPSAPTQIILCDSTCGGINAGSGATVEIVLGCASIG
jgi:hypothetical protein